MLKCAVQPPIRLGIQVPSRHAGAAVMKLVEAARQHAGELILVATGPLTNVALACKLDPEFVGNGEC